MLAAKEILSDALFIPVSQIADDAMLSQIKPFDSLSFEALVLLVEEKTGREADLEALIALKSVRELQDYLDRP